MSSYKSIDQALANLGTSVHGQIKAQARKLKPVKMPKPPLPWQEMLYNLLRHVRPDLMWAQNHCPFPDRDWELDIVVLSLKFAVEVNGQVHAIKEQRIRDAEKGRRVRLAGWYLTWVVNDEVQLNRDATLRQVLDELGGWEKEKENRCIDDSL